MKPKIIQVRGVAFDKAYNAVNDEFLADFDRSFVVVDQLNFLEAYKTNRRGCHFDVFLGKLGTIVFRPFHYVDGLDDFCFFGLKSYSLLKGNAIEFYQWSSKRHSKMELWKNGEHLLTASQKKSIRSQGDKSLIRNKDVYESTSYYIKSMVGTNVEELSSDQIIYRCERRL